MYIRDKIQALLYSGVCTDPVRHNLFGFLPSNFDPELFPVNVYTLCKHSVHTLYTLCMFRFFDIRDKCRNLNLSGNKTVLVHDFKRDKEGREEEKREMGEKE